MAKSRGLDKIDLQFYAFERLQEIVDDPKTTPGVKVQALTQIARLAEQVKNAEATDDSLAAAMEELLNG